MPDLDDLGMGLGAALTTYGEVKTAQDDMKRREELAERLEREREERADQRQQAREERDAARDAKKVAATRVITRDGRMINQSVNSSDEVINERDVDPYQLEQINNARAKDEVELTNARLRGQATQLGMEVDRAQLGMLPRKMALDERVANTNIARDEAEIRRLDRPDPKTAVDTSVGGLTKLLLEESEDLIAQYEDDISASQMRELARATVEKAGKAGIDADVMFPQVLRNWIAKNKPKPKQ